MPSMNTFSVDKLARLIGPPNCPALVDVRPNDDYKADPRLIPGSARRSHADVSAWTCEFTGRSAIAICQSGAKLSEGAAAWMRHAGVAADSLEEGFDGWRKAGLPLVITTRMPALDDHKRTVWVTRARPKVDRIACPWLIRRFVDPSAVFLFVSPAEVEGVAEPFSAAAFDIEGVFSWHRAATLAFAGIVEEFGVVT